ncbi:MAG: hypothetical protein J0G30_12370 [Actinomycetales bacterium]|nr:hypothetical protein [Actinomycetales bacterium]
MRRSVATLVVASAVALLATACVPGTNPTPSPTPTVQPTPLFATEEEALAAARDAYSRYLEVAAEVVNEGGRQPENLEEVLTGTQLELETQAANDLASAGAYIEGSARLVSMDVQSFDNTTVQTYACVDYSELVLHRANGSVESLAVGDPVVPLELGFRVVAETLLLASQSNWDGASFC